MKKIISSTLILVAITLIAGLALAAVYEITKEPIAAAEQAAKENAYRMVMPKATGFSAVSADSAQWPLDLEGGIRINECLFATRDLTKAADTPTEAISLPAEVDSFAETGAPVPANIIGYVISVTSSNGYGGDITLAVGILRDGTISGISVISQGETAGLGAVCAEDKFTSQFAGIKGFVEYVKNGKTEPNQIDALSGATVTTKAVTEAVNAAVAYVNELTGGTQS